MADQTYLAARKFKIVAGNDQKLIKNEVIANATVGWGVPIVFNSSTEKYEANGAGNNLAYEFSYPDTADVDLDAVIGDDVTFNAGRGQGVKINAPVKHTDPLPKNTVVAVKENAYWELASGLAAPFTLLAKLKQPYQDLSGEIEILELELL